MMSTITLPILNAAPTESNKLWKNLKQLAMDIGSLMFGLTAMVLLLTILIAFLVLQGYLLLFLGDAALGATEPCVKVQSIEVVDPLNISYAKIPSMKSPSSVVTGSWNVSLGFCNRGRVKITYYDRMDVKLYYKEAALGNVKLYYKEAALGKSTIRVNDLEQSKRETWMYVDTKLDASAEHMDDLLAYELARDINEGTTTYGVKVDYSAVLEPTWWFNKNSTFSYRIRDTSFDNIWCNAGFFF